MIFCKVLFVGLQIVLPCLFHVYQSWAPFHIFFLGVILCVPLFGDILSAPAWREGHKLLSDIQMKYSDIGYQDIMKIDIRISYILMSDDLILNKIVSII